MDGYQGNLLHIDLSHKKTSIEKISEAFCKKYLGGNGFGVFLLYQHAPPHVDPYSPENPLIFSTGPFAGTIIPATGKYCVNAKSPLTMMYGEAVSSGSWGHALKYSGYDGVIIKGRAEKPLYIFIDDGEVSFLNATGLWGKDSWETDEIIREDLEDENVRVASIGQGGESLVRYGNITNDRNRQAGRCGLGSVMGSKNLKAVAVRGTKPFSVAHLDELQKLSIELIKECQGPRTESYRTYGTPASMAVLDARGLSPTKNWLQSNNSELLETLSAEAIRRDYTPRFLSCMGCPIACDPVSVLKDEPFKGTAAGVEHEGLYALGLMTLVKEFPIVAKAHELCDRYGIDTITCGCTIGWAMECYERGLLTKEDTDGINLQFGNGDAMLEVIRKIAFREGEIGNLLAEGSRRASELLGKGSDYFAMHNKGLELPHYEMRALKCATLGFCTSTRGGHHMTSSPYDMDSGQRKFIYNWWGYEIDPPVDGTKAEARYGRYVADREDWYGIIESMIHCKFTRNVFLSLETMANLYTLVTGISMTPDELRIAGQRVYTLEKAFNVREGWTRQDDYPPPRIFNDPVPTGPFKGTRLTKEEYDMMLDAYYKYREWTVDGIPTRDKLESLGLEDIAEDLWRTPS